jgi:hypothetical protein
MLRRVLLVVVALALVGAFSLAGQEAGAGGGLDFGLNIGIGAESFLEETGTVTYQTLRLSPDISIGKFGLGLDLTLHYLFAPEFQVRTADWVPSGGQNILDVYLPKLKYVRWGLKGEPLYVKLGSIEDGTLGDGFIMGNYDNTVLLPDRRLFGMSFDLDGALFNFPYVGLESFVANLARFDVMGFRPFLRPLSFTGIPVLKNLQLGGTVAFDTDPGLYAGVPGTEPVVFYGADLRVPIVASPAASLIAFGDFAVLHNTGGMGGMVGFGGRLFGFLNYGAQLRMLGENFIPNYFGNAYDLFRYQQYQILQSGTVAAYTGWQAGLGFSLFGDLLSLNASLVGPFGTPDAVDPDNYLNWPHLYMTFLLGEGLIPNLSAEASWDKRSIMEPADLLSAENAAIEGRLNYAIGVAVISFVYRVRYEPGLTPPWVTESGLESSIQLF